MTTGVADLKQIGHRSFDRAKFLSPLLLYLPHDVVDVDLLFVVCRLCDRSSGKAEARYLAEEWIHDVFLVERGMMVCVDMNRRQRIHHHLPEFHKQFSRRQFGSAVGHTAAVTG